jgi:hypothetical protein
VTEFYDPLGVPPQLWAELAASNVFRNANADCGPHCRTPAWPVHCQQCHDEHNPRLREFVKQLRLERAQRATP